MRRVLLAAAAAVPLVALAVTAAPGKLLETTNFNPLAGASYVNLAQCTGSVAANPLNVEFNVQTASGGAPAGGSFNLFASTAAPTTPTGGTGILCAEQDSGAGVTPQVFAGGVGSVPADSAIKDVAVSGTGVMAAVKKPCEAAQESQQIWICAHWTDAFGNRNVGWASGKFIIQLAAPAAPAGVNVGAGDSKLEVSFSPGTGGATDANHFVAYATPSSGGVEVASGSVTSSPATIKGLTNNQEYVVVVRAYSVGGNPSADSAAATGMPRATADFWDAYGAAGGPEQGGCAAGPGGALALLGAAPLLALRRRKP